jgi:hypothetical protein
MFLSVYTTFANCQVKNDEASNSQYNKADKVNGEWTGEWNMLKSQPGLVSYRQIGKNKRRYKQK